MEQLITRIIETSILEWFAVLFGISYVIFIACNKRIGWVFAFLSTIIYSYLCSIAQLYIEASLQIFYVIMALYGWVKWSSLKKELPIIQLQLLSHIKYILLGCFAVIILGFLIGSFTDQASPYLDAFTTVFSLIATFMLARKVLENWLYWIVIDVSLISLYGSRGYTLTAVQYGLFSALAVFGWLKWRKVFKSRTKRCLKLP